MSKFGLIAFSNLWDKILASQDGGIENKVFFEFKVRVRLKKELFKKRCTQTNISDCKQKKKSLFLATYLNSDINSPAFLFGLLCLTALRIKIIHRIIFICAVAEGWTRTKTDGIRIRCPTIRRYPNCFVINISTLFKLFC